MPKKRLVDAETRLPLWNTKVIRRDAALLIRSYVDSMSLVTDIYASRNQIGLVLSTDTVEGLIFSKRSKNAAYPNANKK